MQSVSVISSANTGVYQSVQSSESLYMCARMYNPTNASDGSACRYCLNREPVRFALTRFFIDRFHDTNHKACSKAHFLAHYSDMDGLNSQCAE